MVCGAGGRGERGLAEKWKMLSSAGEGWLELKSDLTKK